MVKYYCINDPNNLIADRLDKSLKHHRFDSNDDSSLN